MNYLIYEIKIVIFKNQKLKKSLISPGHIHNFQTTFKLVQFIYSSCWYEKVYINGHFQVHLHNQTIQNDQYHIVFSFATSKISFKAESILAVTSYKSHLPPCLIVLIDTYCVNEILQSMYFIMLPLTVIIDLQSKHFSFFLPVNLN